MERGSELQRALLSALGGVPLHPPRDLRVLDVVKVPSLQPTGRRAAVDASRAGVLHHEAPFCDLRLADSALWCAAAARGAQALARSAAPPTDVIIVDQEAEELVDKVAAARQLRKEKVSRGIVVKVVYGRLEAVCACAGGDGSEDEDVPLGGTGTGAIAAEVLCADKKGQVYELSQRMLLATDEELRDSCRARMSRHRRASSAFSSGRSQ